MRELNECKAEVFRRSEKRIKERKRIRNRIFACCIPLCFCIALTVALLPPMIPTTDYYDGVAGCDACNKDEYDAVNSIFCSYVEVEIQTVGESQEHYLKITDKPAVDKIFSAIYDLYNVDVNTAKYEVESKDCEYGHKSDSAGEPSCYSITLTTADGSGTTYVLSGNELTDTSTDQILILTDLQLAELKAVLGITE